MYIWKVPLGQMKTYWNAMKSIKTSLFTGFAILIAASSIAPLNANASVSNEHLKEHTQTQQTTTQSNGCRVIQGKGIDCRKL